MIKKPHIITNKYTKQYQEFLLVPESDRLSYNKLIHSIPMEDTDLELPSCNPTYFSKVPAAFESYLNLTTYVWESKQTPKNIIFFNHGLNGNIGSYQHLAQQISTKTPTVVVGHDARHFGRSDGTPRALIKNPTRLFDDLEKVIQWGLLKYGQKLNVFLFGLSMGGRVILEVANRKKFNYRGAIFVVPAMILTPISTIKLGWKQYFKIIFLPQSGISKPTYANSCRHKQFVQTKIKPDQYIYQGQLLAGTVKSFQQLTKRSESQMKKFDLPYLFVQARVDKLIDPFQIRDFDRWSKSEDKTHYYSQDMWHSSCFDQQFITMTPQILTWLETRSQ